MASLVSIWNMALTRVGSTAYIQSETEASNERRTCSAVYEIARDAMLADLDWNFARKRQSLGDIGSPPDNWSYRYTYPSDCIQARYLNESVDGIAPHPFEVAISDDLTTRVVLCNLSPATLVYTAKVENAALFSPGAVEALAWKIGYEIAMPLTESLKIQLACAKGYANTILAAGAATKNEGQKKDDLEAEWVRGRD